MPSDESTFETVWVHGHSGRVQAATGFVEERLGYFLRLKADMDAEAWVHFAVPTAIRSRPRRVLAVSVQLRTWGTATVGAVHLWNGSTRLAAIDDAFASPVGAQCREDATGEPLAVVVRTDLSSLRPVTAAVGVSLLVVAPRPRDAVAVAGVGVSFADLPPAGG